MMKRSLRLALILSPALIAGSMLGIEYSLLYIVLLGLFALGKVIYYSLTFNDCQSASESLRKEIKEARGDLAKRGFNFITQ